MVDIKSFTIEMDISGPTYKYVLQDMIRIFGEKNIGKIKAEIYITREITFREYNERVRNILIKNISNII